MNCFKSGLVKFYLDLLKNRTKFIYFFVEIENLRWILFELKRLYLFFFYNNIHNTKTNLNSRPVSRTHVCQQKKHVLCVIILEGDMSNDRYTF